MMRLLLLFVTLTPLFAQAQIGNICVDSNRVNPYYRCDDPQFDPVCGCNNVTYRNGCEMTNIGGVNYSSQFEVGVCRSDFFYHFISPNPASEKIDFSMQFADQMETSVLVQIYNIYGNVVLSRNYNNIKSYPVTPETIYLYDLETGVYVFMVQAAGITKVTKFIKHAF